MTAGLGPFAVASFDARASRHAVTLRTVTCSVGNTVSTIRA